MLLFGKCKTESMKINRKVFNKNPLETNDIIYIKMHPKTQKDLKMENLLI